MPLCVMPPDAAETPEDPEATELETYTPTRMAAVTAAPPAKRSIARLGVPCRVSDASSTVTVIVAIEKLPEVSVVRMKIVFCHSRKVCVAVHEVVPGESV